MDNSSKDTLNITEIFYSLQGEAKDVGIPTVFIRLTGCPLRCNYCDTTYAFKGNNPLTIEAILAEVRQYNTRYVCVTGGEPLAQSVLDGRFTLSILLTIFAARFLLGPLSLSASTPGGYFTPVLTLGALIGMAYGLSVGAVFPAASISASSFALVGMGVALGTVTRAPITGVLLTMETTGSFAVLLPMTLAMFGAGVVTQMLRSPSIETALHNLRATG